MNPFPMSAPSGGRLPIRAEPFRSLDHVQPHFRRTLLFRDASDPSRHWRFAACSFRATRHWRAGHAPSRRRLASVCSRGTQPPYIRPAGDRPNLPASLRAEPSPCDEENLPESPGLTYRITNGESFR